MAMPPGDLWAGNAFTAPAAQAMEAGDYERALGYYRSALSVAKTDRERIDMADKLHKLGLSAHMRNKGQGRIALAAFEEALPIFVGGKRWEDAAITSEDQAETVTLLGDTKCARVALERATGFAEKVEDKGNLRGDILYSVGDFHLTLGDYNAAAALTNRSLALRRQAKNREGTADCLRNLGCIASDRGEYREADSYFSEAETILAGIGATETRAAAVGEHGDNQLRQNKLDRAEALYQEGLAVWQARKQDYWTGVFLARLARIACFRGNLVEAKRLASQSLQLLSESNGPVSKAAPLDVLGNIARATGDYAGAESLHKQSLALRQVFGNPRCLAEETESLALDAMAQQQWQKAQSLLVQAKQLRMSVQTPLPPIALQNFTALKAETQ